MRDAITNYTDMAVGPLALDVSLAITLGWSAEDIGATAFALQALSRGIAQTVARRLGHLRICEACECWTFPKRPCHLCAYDRNASAPFEPIGGYPRRKAKTKKTK